MEIRIKIPEELKSYIVDDWAQICRRKRLTILPARSWSIDSRDIIWKWLNRIDSMQSITASDPYRFIDKNPSKTAVLMLTTFSIFPQS